MAAMAVDAGAPAAVKERLEAFAGEVLAAAMNRPVQRVNGALYVRGLRRKGLASRLSRLSRDWAQTPTTSRCSNLWLIVRGTRRGSWRRWLSGSRR